MPPPTPARSGRSPRRRPAPWRTARRRPAPRAARPRPARPAPVRPRPCARRRQVVEPLEHGVHQRAADRGEALALGQPVDGAEAVEQRAGLEVRRAAGGQRRTARRLRVARPPGRPPRGASAAGSVLHHRRHGSEARSPLRQFRAPAPRRATQVTSGPVRTLAARGHAARARPTSRRRPSREAAPRGPAGSRSKGPSWSATACSSPTRRGGCTPSSSSRASSSTPTAARSTTTT